jgi:hypothetical protein
MGSGPKANVVFRDVFQHTAENTEKLRETIIDDVLQCIKNAEHHGAHPLLGDLRMDMGEEVYGQLKDKYDNKCDPLLYYRSFSLGGLTLLDGLSWKWTEATGKYIGCQFWSNGAKALVDDERNRYGKELYLKEDAWKIAAGFSQRDRLPKSSRITHEHVYPRKDFKRLPFHAPNQSRDTIRALFDRLCIGCVVLESEHPRKCLDPANPENPWLRYAHAGIKLADNPEWPLLQREMIEEAGLCAEV